MTDRKIFVSQTHAFPHYEGAFGVAYRIEADLTDQYCPLQRHIWVMRDGSENAEDWIRSIPVTAEQLASRGWVAA